MITDPPSSRRNVLQTVASGTGLVEVGISSGSVTPPHPEEVTSTGDVVVLSLPDTEVHTVHVTELTPAQQRVHAKIAAMAAMASLGACTQGDVKILTKHQDINKIPAILPKHCHVVGRDNGKSPKTQERNDPCNCGSGLKFKKCCIGKTK